MLFELGGASSEAPPSFLCVGLQKFTYDFGGNILTKKGYVYTTGTVGAIQRSYTYVYGDTNWKDKLTAINGDKITSDAIGNPLSDGTWTYKWAKGRQLQSMNKTGTSISYTYNEDGLRVGKNVNGTVTNYVLHGKNVVHLTRGSDSLHFYYGADGHPTVVEYNGVSYSYAYNLQGDVISLQDADGWTQVQYAYDAWGHPIGKTGAMANTLGTLNPFRYRGYLYDEETGFYYVSSRYYNPAVGRWINADDVDCLGAEGALISNNLFAYCLNNPINRTDVDGNWSLPNWAKVAIGAVATVAAVAITVATGGAAAPVLLGVATSTVSGAAIGAITHRVTTGSWDGAGKAALDGAADGFMAGGLGALGGSVIGGATRTIKNARSGITIGKGDQFKDVAKIAQTRCYSGLKEFKYIEKKLGTKAAETVGWWQNKCVVKGVMALKGPIYDCGGALTGAYAKEVALTKGYKYLYNVWLM